MLLHAEMILSGEARPIANTLVPYLAAYGIGT
jgi:hypothetical protein